MVVVPVGDDRLGYGDVLLLQRFSQGRYPGRFALSCIDQETLSSSTDDVCIGT